MSIFGLWILIVFIYIIIGVTKGAGKKNTNGTADKKQLSSNVARPNVMRKDNKGVESQRSFAALPKQNTAVPNKERNCTAEDKHRFENNVSGYSGKRTSATPNVQSPVMHKQPKMSGNRREARQLYIGDPIPQGMKLKKCDYCAAENLVPYTARNEFKCYFCHYDI